MVNRLLGPQPGIFARLGQPTEKRTGCLQVAVGAQRHIGNASHRHLKIHPVACHQLDAALQVGKGVSRLAHALEQLHRLAAQNARHPNAGQGAQLAAQPIQLAPGFGRCRCLVTQGCSVFGH